MQDKILIKNIPIDCIIGIYEEEKLKKQKLRVDLQIDCCFDKTIKSDNIKDAVDYDEVYQTLKEFADNSKFELLESFAHFFCKEMFDKFDISKIEIKVYKLSIEYAELVGVSIVRTKKDF